MALVIDVSAIAGLAFPDEDSTYAKSLLDAIDASVAVVPWLFWFELRNMLLMGERRGRATEDQTTAFLSHMDVLPFEVDDRPRDAVLFALARRHKLTVYDAAYLELAQRKNLAMATLDQSLARAAAAAGVAVWQVLR